MAQQPTSDVGLFDSNPSDTGEGDETVLQQDEGASQQGTPKGSIAGGGP